jgi:sugar-specific transcriptional regulator TrmB
MLEEKNIQRLAELGLATSQAKVYLALVQLGKSKAALIAKTTEIDRAEVYRTIAKLEKKGFVLRIIGNPTKFEAVPLKNLLTTIIQQKRSEISKIEKSANQLLRQNMERKTYKAEDYFRIAPKWINNTTEVISDLEKTEKQLDQVLPKLSDIMESASSFGEWERLFEKMERGVKMRVVCNEGEKNRILEIPKKMAHHPNFIMRYAAQPIDCGFVIVDGKKIWIKIRNGTDFLTDSWLITNNEHLIKLLQCYFDLLFANSTS